MRKWGQKSNDCILKALQVLPKKYKLLLAGDGELKNEIENLAKTLDLSDRVHFLGNRNDVPQLLKSVDVIILSSNHEGLSLSSIEALASGKPFIASDVPGLREIVKSYGLVFEKGNIQDLVEKILSMEQSSELRTKVIATCMTRAQDFDIQKMITAYIKLYHKATTS